MHSVNARITPHRRRPRPDLADINDFLRQSRGPRRCSPLAWTVLIQGTMENLNMTTTISPDALQQAIAAAATLAPHLTVHDGKVCVLVPVAELTPEGAVALVQRAAGPVEATQAEVRAHSTGASQPRATAPETAPKHARKFLRAVVKSKLRKNANIKRLKLTPRQEAVLALVHKQGPRGLAEAQARKIAPKRVAKHVEHGPWSSTVDWLVKHGLVEKVEADPRWMEKDTAAA